MQWEQLTAPDFQKAVKDTGVCILAMGVLERHGEHLPLGTDYINGHKITSLAAEKEAAVVFPPFYFGQIYEARCFPGALTLKPSLLIEVIQGVLDEIGRNGFKKIIIYNAHGGNTHLIDFLAQCTLWEEKDYSVYAYTGLSYEDSKKVLNEICDTKLHGHACECETSVSLYNHQHLVRMDMVPENPGNPLNRSKDLPQNFSGISWYSNYPEHYAGDARTASVEKGKAIVELEVDSFARFIAAVKADTVIPGLNKEFFDRVKKVKG